MCRPRFSLRWLMVSVYFIAVACGLLVYATPLTASGAFGATLLLLFAAVPLGVYGAGERRAFWFGFVLFGLGYLVVACGDWQAPHAYLNQVRVRDGLPTTKLLELVYKWLPTKPAAAGMGGGLGGGGMFKQIGGGGMGGPARVPIADLDSFAVIGQSLWAVVLAVGGGAFARWCQRTSR